MILVAGVGNLLREDDSIGVRVVEYLNQSNKNKNIEFIDAGINSFRLLDIIKDYEKVIIIDGVNFQAEAGQVKKIPLEIILDNEVCIFSQLSMHSFNLKEFFNFAKMEGDIHKIILIGIQPFSIEYKNELSNILFNKFQSIISEVEKIINYECAKI